MQNGEKKPKDLMIAEAAYNEFYSQQPQLFFDDLSHNYQMRWVRAVRAAIDEYKKATPRARVKTVRIAAPERRDKTVKVEEDTQKRKILKEKLGKEVEQMPDDLPNFTEMSAEMRRRSSRISYYARRLGIPNPINRRAT